LIAPLLEEVSPRPSARTMYHRLGEQEVRGSIDVYRTARSGRALVKITGKGKAALEGLDDLPSTEERSP